MTRPRRPRIATAVVALALVAAAAACTESETDPLTGIPLGPGGGGIDAASNPEGLAETAIADVTAYWQQAYPEVYGAEFATLAGTTPFGPDTPIPPCGGLTATYAEVAENAFYCAPDDYIAWDEVNLIPWLNEQFGSFTIGIVFAHEMGHAVQSRAGVAGRTIDLELQADCFAGAWTAFVSNGGSQTFTLDETTLDASVAGMVAISDLPGTTEDDPAAHGSGFDRIGSFQEGYEGGAFACEAYAGEERRTVEIPFDDSDVDEGNMALDDGADAPEGVGLLSRFESDLNDFYGQLFDELGATFQPVDDLVVADPGSDEPSCGGESLGADQLTGAALYCQDENTVVIDRTGLVEPLYAIGDFAVAAEIARLWAEAAQVQMGTAPGPEASLQADCLTGVWAVARFPESGVPSQYLTMSAGDLDEGIMGFLTYGLGAESGSVFERTDALRTGFIDGYTGCEQYGPLG